MDPQTIRGHLASAEEHVRTAVMNVVRQHEVIAELGQGGHDTADARMLLRHYEEVLTLHIAHRDRLQEELGQIRERPDSAPRRTDVEKPTSNP